MSVAALILLSMDEAREQGIATDKRARKVLYGLVAVAIILPASALSVSTVNQRLDVNPDGTSGLSSGLLETQLSNSSRSLSIDDWSQLLVTQTDPGFYANKPVSVTGFIFDAGLGNDTLMLSRFTVTCCAVDARPAGIPVRVENWQDLYSEDDWLHIEGQFQRDSGAIVLQPTTVEQVEEPTNPYEN